MPVLTGSVSTMPAKTASAGIPAQSAAPQNSIAHKRKPGRPARISREAIIQKAIEILAGNQVDDLMLKTVAQELGTVSMAIYNYFGSREELLEAVADEVCLLFKMPTARKTWQEDFMAWLWAVKKHADRYPVIHNVMGINGHTSAGWLRLAEPIINRLHYLGLRGKEQALVSYLFLSSAAAMIKIVVLGKEFRSNSDYPALAGLSEKRILDTYFTQLIEGVERMLPAGSGRG